MTARNGYALNSYDSTVTKVTPVTPDTVAAATARLLAEDDADLLLDMIRPDLVPLIRDNTRRGRGAQPSKLAHLGVIGGRRAG